MGWGCRGEEWSVGKWGITARGGDMEWACGGEEVTCGGYVGGKNEVWDMGDRCEVRGSGDVGI